VIGSWHTAKKILSNIPAVYKELYTAIEKEKVASWSAILSRKAGFGAPCRRSEANRPAESGI